MHQRMTDGGNKLAATYKLKATDQTLLESFNSTAELQRRLRILGLMMAVRSVPPVNRKQWN